MSLTNEQVQQLIEARKTKFIETRKIIETRVDKFLKSLEVLDDTIKQQINWIPDQTAKTMLPELWSDDFNEEKYQEQLNAFLQYESRIRLVFDEINAEAYRCLQELN